MNLLNQNIKDISFYYVNKLIVNPLVQYGYLNLDEFDIKKLVDLVQNALVNTKSTQRLASDIGHYTKTWNIEWDWIAHHITWDYHNITQARYILKTFGYNKTCYKSISNTHSPKAHQLYLTDSSNIMSEPKTFLLSELISNGSNIGRKEIEWKPVIGITDFGFRKHPLFDNPEYEEVEHYYDNSFLFSKSDWVIWDEKEGTYNIDQKPLTEKQKKIFSSIKVTITDDNGNVIKSKNRSPKRVVNINQPDKQKNVRKWWQKLFMR